MIGLPQPHHKRRHFRERGAGPAGPSQVEGDGSTEPDSAARPDDREAMPAEPGRHGHKQDAGERQPKPETADQPVTPEAAPDEPGDPAPVRAEPVRSSSWADVVAHGGPLGRGYAFAASSRGSSHVETGDPREDAYALRSCSPDIAVVAVADGIGASRQAHAAATIAVTQWVSAAATWALEPSRESWELYCRRMVTEISTSLADDARVSGVGRVLTPSAADNPDKYQRPAATLAAALLQWGPHGEVDVWWLTYGDTVVLCLRDGEQQWRWVSPDPGRVRQHAVSALPGPAERAECGQVRIAPRDVLTLMSDGVWPPVLGEQEKFAQTMRQAWGTRISPAVFATFLDFDFPGESDDRTILAIRSEAPGR